jgi:hypothetical protein
LALTTQRRVVGGVTDAVVVIDVQSEVAVTRNRVHRDRDSIAGGGWSELLYGTGGPTTEREVTLVHTIHLLAEGDVKVDASCTRRGAVHPLDCIDLRGVGDRDGGAGSVF